MHKELHHVSVYTDGDLSKVFVKQDAYGWDPFIVLAPEQIDAVIAMLLEARDELRGFGPSEAEPSPERDSGRPCAPNGPTRRRPQDAR
jgi:hypothetical protein